MNRFYCCFFIIEKEEGDDDKTKTNLLLSIFCTKIKPSLLFRNCFISNLNKQKITHTKHNLIFLYH